MIHGLNSYVTTGQLYFYNLVAGATLNLAQLKQ